MTKRKNRTGRKSVLVIILGLCIITGFYFFLHSSLFLIKKIAVEGNKFVKSEDIIALAGINLGDNLFDYKAETSEKAVKIIPRVKNVDIRRSLPNKVNITVTERYPWALLLYKSGVMVVDAEGVCLEKMRRLPDSKLPVISMTGVSDRIVPGQKVNASGISLIKKIVDTLPGDIKKQVSEYHYKGNGQVFVYTMEGTEIRLGGTDRLTEKVSLWKRIMAASGETGSGAKLEYIDLRYEGLPVIQEKK